MFVPDLLHGQDADWGSLLVRPWIQRAAGLAGGPGAGGPAPFRTSQPSPGKALPIRSLGQWRWATWRAEDARRRHRFHSTRHPRLLSQPWEGNVPSGRHPKPTKRPLLELEVRICGRRDSWVRVPAYCQLPGRWANISGIKRGAACPARPSGGRRCHAPRLPSSAKALSCEEREERVPSSDSGGRSPSRLQASVGLLEASPRE